MFSVAIVVKDVDINLTEAHLDIRRLNFFGQIDNDNSSILYQISLRQLALKNLSSASWLMGVIQLCFKNNLPSPHSIILDPQPIDKWKTTVKKTVSVYWKEKIQLEASSKSTLGRLSITNNENLKKASSLDPFNTNAVAKHTSNENTKRHLHLPV